MVSFRHTPLFACTPRITQSQTIIGITESQKGVSIYEGDRNEILLTKAFPQVQYTQYRRGLCLLDPYGLHLDWRVIKTAGQMQSLEIFLNFPVADMNRNVLWRDSAGVDQQQAGRMTKFWGDESWKQAAYDKTGNLFGWEEKQSNESVASAFRERLKKVAGFSHVPEPIPMRNSKGAIVYYLFFASPKPVAAKIVKSIFDKYRDKGIK
jgi:three-Cys-motif partner protein